MTAFLGDRKDRWTALVVSGGGWPGDYDIVRSLGHAGIRCAVASSDPASIAFRSRFVDAAIPLPPFEPRHAGRIVSLLLEAARRFVSAPVLFYVGDSELLLTAEYRGALSSFYRFLLPDPGLLDNLTSKSAFHDFALKNDIPVPEGVVVRSMDELHRLREIPFPCIVKPSFNRDWFPVADETSSGYKGRLRRFADREELLAFCRGLPSWESGILIQSFVGTMGHPVTSFLGYFDEASRCLGSFVGRDVRTIPPFVGDATFSEIIENDDLRHAAIAMLSRIGMRGIVKVDYVLDEDRGTYQVLEIEPHFQAWHLLGSYAGMNLPLVAYQHLRREPLTGIRSAKSASLLWFRPDVTAYLRAYRKTGHWTFVRYVRSLVRPSCFRIFDAHDPRPFLASSLNLLKKVAGRMKTTLFGFWKDPGRLHLQDAQP